MCSKLIVFVVLLELTFLAGVGRQSGLAAATDRFTDYIRANEFAIDNDCKNERAVHDLCEECAKFIKNR